jgi:hypothetical protein
MLLATIAVIGPALARLARLPIFGGEQGVFTSIVTLALLAAVVVHHVLTTRRIHSATVLGISFALGLFFVMSAVAQTELGLNFVCWLQ